MPVKTPDPMDLPPEGEYKDGDNIRWAAEAQNRILSENLPPFTWDQIRADAAAEFKARITEFHVSKNSRYVDWMLETLHQNDNLPDDLLSKTQAITRETHMEADK